MNSQTELAHLINNHIKIVNIMNSWDTLFELTFLSPNF